MKRDNTMFVYGKTLEGYQAGHGWDPVTGWETPIASVLEPLLAPYDPLLSQGRDGDRRLEQNERCGGVVIRPLAPYSRDLYCR